MMIRNLDVTALRSFVAVADTGGVTRAAERLNLTQSAVSMQLKRLEESLGQPLLDRSGRGVRLTSQGEQLLSYGRRMLDLNDEVMVRMRDRRYEGEIHLGVPTDIVYPHIPTILKRMDREFPRMRIHLLSLYTSKLREIIDTGKADLILTTENECGPGGETLVNQQIVWVGAPGGVAWRQRPLRLAFERNCLFRSWVQRALDDVGIPWEMAVDTSSTRTVEASLSADLAVHAMLESAVPPHLEPIPTDSGLPTLPATRINMYRNPDAKGPPIDTLANMLRTSYGKLSVAAE